MPFLTAEDARRALYIDFEGRTDKPPVLLGCTRRSQVRSDASVWQAVTDPRFEPLATADGLETLELADAVERILRRADSKDRLIVAWSQHELDVVREYVPDKVDRFAGRYVNARSFAVRWRNRCHGGDKPDSNRLADWLAFTGYVVPEGAGRGRSGETIGILGDAFDRGRTVDQLTSNQRDRWRDLRAHNWHDCTGMRSIVTKAAQEIGDPARRVTNTGVLVDTIEMMRPQVEAT